jgi:transaldolase / glucose-6-phosphate isomerase
MKNISGIQALGQSIWLDNIQRSLIANGDLKRMINSSLITGITSNPSIFQNAIAKTTDYEFMLKPMAWSGLHAEEIFWELAVRDIQDATDLFRDVYESSGHKDGFVSLEVNPHYGNDTIKTVAEVKQLWKKVNRPNVMIKIPATKEGIPAIKQMIAAGINVNITLIFSLDRYQEVIEAFLSGLEERSKAGESVKDISSVASFFVSRVDTKVDLRLNELLQTQKIDQKTFDHFAGKAAIANAKLAYQLFRQIFTSERFLKLEKKGAQLQRPLWASTSTKNPKYKDVVYLEELIGADTVNTVPPATLAAFDDHGKAALTIGKGLDEASQLFVDLEKLGIRIADVTAELEVEGVKAFSDAFSGLISTIEERRLIAVEGLHGLTEKVSQSVKKLSNEKFVDRLFQHDPSLWTSDGKGQAEIRERMDWLEAPVESKTLVEKTRNLLSECRSAGFTHALLLGMGGSSLAPEVLRLINGLGETGLDLSILDSTNPDEVALAADRSPIEKTLFIVSSKSGTTGEINAFFNYFWQRVDQLFPEKAGSHFIAITDPETKLDSLAKERKFRYVFNANPRVGGRNSALTAFGMIPAQLLGINSEVLLDKATELRRIWSSSKEIRSNQGVVLGVIMAEAALKGQNKLTLVTDNGWNAFGNWLEQLVAESSGKIGKGIVPVANEPEIQISRYSKDRLFAYLRTTGEKEDRIHQLREAGHPVVIIDARSTEDIGAQFYLWEVAIATACSIIGVNSFDQPDVQDAKTRTLAGIDSYKKSGKLNPGEPIYINEEGEVFGKPGSEFSKGGSLSTVIQEFLSKNVEKGDYVAINAYVPRTTENEEKLQKLRSQILNKFGNATTLGFGPRFLHSTGQLHKGGPNSGVFIEITGEPNKDIDIPGEGITFGTLVMAQGIGDYQALTERGRRVIRIHTHKADIEILLPKE